MEQDPTDRLKLPANPRPTPEQLALIAAQLLPSCDGDATRAVAEAARLWRASVDAVAALTDDPELEAEFQALRAEAAQIDAQRAISFEQMLRNLMPWVKVEDRVRNFRDYLRETSGGDGADLLGEWRAKKIVEAEYLEISGPFLEWRQKHISKVRSEVRRKALAGREKP